MIGFGFGSGFMNVLIFCMYIAIVLLSSSFR